ncbi:MAG: hypothetical protein Q8J90_06990, partial [Gallionella sp.]|nr:hypothetical protein [Gallionella sp.]
MTASGKPTLSNVECLKANGVLECQRQGFWIKTVGTHSPAAIVYNPASFILDFSFMLEVSNLACSRG